MSEQGAYGHKDRDSRMLLQDKRQSGGEHEDPAAWLRETDIVSHDFPYAASLIAESFREWLGQGVPSFAKTWNWCVLNYEGDWIEPGSEFRQGRWRADWVEAGESACRQVAYTPPRFWRKDKPIHCWLCRYLRAGTGRYLLCLAAGCRQISTKWAEGIRPKRCRCISRPVFLSPV
ncbi:hypothetical protein ACFSQ7_30340 [Paenibacillus rhizoplanae]